MTSPPAGDWQARLDRVDDILDEIERRRRDAERDDGRAPEPEPPPRRPPDDGAPPAVPARWISSAGIELICRFEGFVPRVYRDAAGHPTIGYGHLLDSALERDLYEGREITEAEARMLLRADVMTAQRAIWRLVRVPLAQPQFDALASWTFNLGGGALQRSTLRQKLNRGEYAEVPAEMRRWVYAGGRKLRGLVRRRRAEADMWARA